MFQDDHSTATSVHQSGGRNGRGLLYRGVVSASALTLALTAGPALLHAQAAPDANPPGAVSDQATGTAQGQRNGRRPPDGERVRDGRNRRGGERARDGQRVRDGGRAPGTERPRGAGPRQR